MGLLALLVVVSARVVWRIKSDDMMSELSERAGGAIKTFGLKPSSPSSLRINYDSIHQGYMQKSTP